MDQDLLVFFSMCLVVVTPYPWDFWLNLSSAPDGRLAPYFGLGSAPHPNTKHDTMRFGSRHRI